MGASVPAPGPRLPGASDFQVQCVGERISRQRGQIGIFKRCTMKVFTEADAQALCKGFMHNCDRGVIQLIIGKPQARSLIQLIDPHEMNTCIEDLRTNEPFVFAVIELYKRGIPSGYVLAAAIYLLNAEMEFKLLFIDKCLLGMTRDKALRLLCIGEGFKLKKLIQHMGRLVRRHPFSGEFKDMKLIMLGRVGQPEADSLFEQLKSSSSSEGADGGPSEDVSLEDLKSPPPLSLLHLLPDLVAGDDWEEEEQEEETLTISDEGDRADLVSQWTDLGVDISLEHALLDHGPYTAPNGGTWSFVTFPEYCYVDNAALGFYVQDEVIEIEDRSIAPTHHITQYDILMKGWADVSYQR
jgi:hypothetical protein